MEIVTCATSRTGSVAAQQLLDAGRAVRVVVRNAERGTAWRRQGAEVAVADYRDVEAMTAALAGGDVAYVIPPPLPVTAEGHHPYRVHCTRRLAEALQAAQVPRVVALSSFAAQHPAGTGMIQSCHECERILAEDYEGAAILLRPTFFLENWAAQIPTVRGEGVLPSFLGPADRKFAMVGTSDVGAFAARLMLEPGLEDRVVEFTGPEDYSLNDLAEAFERLLGRRVRPAIYPVEAMAAFLVKQGFSPETAANYQELFAGMMTGHVSLEGRGPLWRGRRSLLEVLAGMLGAGAAAPEPVA